MRSINDQTVLQPPGSGSATGSLNLIFGCTLLESAGLFGHAIVCLLLITRIFIEKLKYASEPIFDPPISRSGLE